MSAQQPPGKKKNHPFCWVAFEFIFIYLLLRNYFVLAGTLTIPILKRSSIIITKTRRLIRTSEKEEKFIG
jgi:hypothetical protein